VPLGNAQLARNLVQLLLEMRSWTCVTNNRYCKWHEFLDINNEGEISPFPKFHLLLQYRTVNYKLKLWGASNLEDLFHLNTPMKFIRPPSGLATRSVTACKIRVAVQTDEQLDPRKRTEMKTVCT